jgi:hypothetical protein
MVLILFVFDNFSNFMITCQPPECSDFEMFMTMLFGFFVTAIFVLIDTIVCFLIIKEKPWKAGEAGQAYKKSAPKDNKHKRLSALTDRLEGLKLAKEEAEKQYYKGKFNQRTFERMLNNYDQKIIEVKSSIKGLKSRPGSKKRKAK